MYNNKRPHLSCDMITPEIAHQGFGKLKRRWKNYYKKPEILESLVQNYDKSIPEHRIAIKQYLD